MGAVRQPRFDSLPEAISCADLPFIKEGLDACRAEICRDLTGKILVLGSMTKKHVWGGHEVLTSESYGTALDRAICPRIPHRKDPGRESKASRRIRRVEGVLLGDLLAVVELVAWKRWPSE